MGMGMHGDTTIQTLPAKPACNQSVSLRPSMEKLRWSLGLFCHHRPLSCLEGWLPSKPGPVLRDQPRADRRGNSRGEPCSSLPRAVSSSCEGLFPASSSSRLFLNLLPEPPQHRSLGTKALMVLMAAAPGAPSRLPDPSGSTASTCLLFPWASCGSKGLKAPKSGELSWWGMGVELGREPWV